MSMRILYVSSEVTPFAASGGLGDVMGSLPRAVRASLGKDSEIGVILPLYDAIGEEDKGRMKKLWEGIVPLAWRRSYAAVYALKRGGVSYYFVESRRYFKRPHLYGEYDDCERFAFFCRAVLEFILGYGQIPDILHANDWQSALTVVYLKTLFRDHPALSRVRAVYTVHNIEFQGKYGREVLGDVLGLSDAHEGLLEFDGCINLCKGALVLCDAVTTVSRRYAEELREPFFSHGLSPIVSMIGHKLTGIVNGLDTSYFSPQNGEELAFPYRPSTLGNGKRENKKFLQERLGLRVDGEVPLLTMVTRLTRQKGIDLLLHILDELLEEDIQFVLLGCGDADYEYILSEIAARHKDRARVLLSFDRLLSKQIYAGGDLFLMPSQSEPCGLSQMIACRYGTVPIVRSVGGLADTILPYGKKGANGFAFSHYNAHDLLFCVKDALALYAAGGKEWDALRRSAMRSDFSWRRSAEEYIALYRKL